MRREVFWKGIFIKTVQEVNPLYIYQFSSYIFRIIAILTSSPKAVNRFPAIFMKSQLILNTLLPNVRI